MGVPSDLAYLSEPGVALMIQRGLGLVEDQPRVQHGLHHLLDLAVVHTFRCELVGDPRGYDGAFSALDAVARNHVGNLGVLELGIGGEIVQGLIHRGLT